GPGRTRCALPSGGDGNDGRGNRHKRPRAAGGGGRATGCEGAEPFISRRASEALTPQQLRSLLQSPHDEAAPAIRPRRETKKVARHEIVSAVEEREFVAYFQPKIDCNSGEVTGLEALARWQHPQKGILTPEHFIPQAEKSNLINQISNQIAESALLWFGQHYRDSHLEIALNHSGRAMT